MTKKYRQPPQPTVAYDPAGTDEEHPAACVACRGDAYRTDIPRPSGYGTMVECVECGLVSTGMPRLGHPSLVTRKELP